MARNRKCGNLKTGEYQGAAIWQCGSGIEERTRYAEGIGIKVAETWVYLYLRDGEEIVRLSRKANSSAQIYLEMTLHDALKERIVNSVENNSSCCWGQFGWERHCGGEESLHSERTPCTLHTAEWLEAEIQAKLDSIIADEEWPSVLVQRKIDAVKAAERLAEMEIERDAAREAGYGEWRNSGGTWLVSIDGHGVGDIVAVRRRNGTVSHHELTVQVSPMLFKVGEAIPEAEVELRRTRKVIVFVPSPMPKNVVHESRKPVKFAPSPMAENVFPERRKQPRFVQNRDGSWTVEKAIGQ
jgi:hypothetical protein